MYLPLKKAIWNEIDLAIFKQFNARPIKKLVKRRAYRLRNTAVAPFLVVDFDEFAGGRFSFLFALGRGVAPDSETVYSDKFTVPPQDSVCLIDDRVLGLDIPNCAIDLNWQVPPKEKINELLKSEQGRTLLNQLGVTETEKHHMVSFEILEALGARFEKSDFLPIVERARAIISKAIDGPVKIAVEVFISRCEAQSIQHA